MTEARSVLRRALERQVISDEVTIVRERLRDWVRPGLTDTQRSLVVTLAGPFVRANVVVDTAATERNRQRARDEVQPVRVAVQRGEVVIRDGSIITAADVEKLEQLGLRDRTTSLVSRHLQPGRRAGGPLAHVCRLLSTGYLARPDDADGRADHCWHDHRRPTDLPAPPTGALRLPYRYSRDAAAVLLDVHLAVMVGGFWP
jgi:hypothetical protein